MTEAKIRKQIATALPRNTYDRLVGMVDIMGVSKATAMEAAVLVALSHSEEFASMITTLKEEKEEAKAEEKRRWNH